MVVAYFTPATGFAGGALIGLSAATLLLVSGDILGASSLVSSTILSPRKAVSDPALVWKLVFLSTFVLLSNVVLGPHFSDDVRLSEDPSIPIVSVYGYLLGGGFVGFGTRMGNGCTTGHGICGMARLSPRSIAAVCTFMLSAFCTAALTAPDNKATSEGTSFLRTDEVPELFNRWLGFGISMVIVVLPTLYGLYNLYRTSSIASPTSSENNNGNNNTTDEGQGAKIECSSERTQSNMSIDIDESGRYEEPIPVVEGGDVEEQLQESPNPTTFDSQDEQQEPAKTSHKEDFTILAESRRKLVPAALTAALFAIGLAVSGMVLPSKVLGFLNPLLFAKGSYDPTLLTVMVAGCIISFVAYQFVQPFAAYNPYARECPLVTSKFSVPTNKALDVQLLGGATCFGIGWGIAGLCPGPAIYLAATGTFPVICYWWPAFLAGSFVAQSIKR